MTTKNSVICGITAENPQATSGIGEATSTKNARKLRRKFAHTVAAIARYGRKNVTTRLTTEAIAM
jgi:hypothetical protein